MKILVTGAAGYLGSVLTELLLNEGYAVTALDNFMYRQQSLSHLCHHSTLGIVRGDSRNMATINALLKHADVIVPLAAIVGAPACEIDVDACWSTNRDAIMKLCHEASKDQLIIFPNTNSGYGKGSKAACTESDPINPISSYGRSKGDAEQVVLVHKSGIALRFATLFGASPRMRLDLMVNDFTYRAVREGYLVLYESQFRRNFLHVRDAAGAILHAIVNANSMRGNIYNCGDDRANMTKAELARTVFRVLGKEPVVIEHPGAKDPDQRDYVVSNAKLLATSWRPQHTLEAGIRELAQCFRQPFESLTNRNI